MSRLGDEAIERDEWLVLRASWPFHDLLDLLNRLGEYTTNESWQIDASQTLDTITSWLKSDQVSVEDVLILDNAGARLAYLNNTPILTATQINVMSGLKSRNPSEPASRWQKEGKSFGLQDGRRYLYPAFQFNEGRPRDVVKKILDVLPPEMTSWQKALWFASGNGWLEGESPQQRLEDPKLVVEAARQLSNLARG